MYYWLCLYEAFGLFKGIQQVGWPFLFTNMLHNNLFLPIDTSWIDGSDMLYYLTLVIRIRSLKVYLLKAWTFVFTHAFFRTSLQWKCIYKQRQCKRKSLKSIWERFKVKGSTDLFYLLPSILFSRCHMSG